MTSNSKERFIRSAVRSRPERPEPQPRRTLFGLTIYLLRKVFKDRKEGDKQCKQERENKS
jgi:hypothetical protein